MPGDHHLAADGREPVPVGAGGKRGRWHPAALLRPIHHSAVWQKPLPHDIPSTYLWTRSHRIWGRISCRVSATCCLLEYHGNWQTPLVFDQLECGRCFLDSEGFLKHILWIFIVFLGNMDKLNQENQWIDQSMSAFCHREKLSFSYNSFLHRFSSIMGVDKCFWLVLPHGF